MNQMGALKTKNGIRPFEIFISYACKIAGAIIIFCLLCSSLKISAQEQDAQIPGVLQNTYFEVNIGYINYPFSKDQLKAGYSLTTSVDVPHLAPRLVLFGYEFNKYISAQITYMRPVLWVHYNYSDDNSGKTYRNSVWMNVGGMTLKPTIPVGKNFTVYGEIGLGLITRHGFKGPDDLQIVSNEKFNTFLFGTGLKYQTNDHWAFQICTNFSPENKTHNQPYTAYTGVGFSYKFSKFSNEQIKRTLTTGYIYPKQWIQIGYASNIFGYNVNNAISEAYLFWGGNVEVSKGLSVNYQKNVFHGAKVFALDWGLNASFWRSNINEETFYTLSAFPVFRINFLHIRPFDAYFYYSVAGPTYISKVFIDELNTGAHFTFQDNMGIGVFFGKNRNYNAELKIGHYSNGNIYPSNESVKVPLSINIGYAY
jgi:hypothetical protein